MSVCFNIDYSEEIKKINKNNKKTERNYNSVLLVDNNNNSFEAGGSFSQEELIEKNGQVYAIVIEKTDSDSYSSHENKNFEVIEFFLDINKAKKLYEVINLYNKLNIDLSYNINNKNEEQLVDEFIQVLNDSYGIKKEKDYIKYGKTKKVSEDFLNKIEYEDEKGNMKFFKIDWFYFGTNLSDIFVLEKKVLNYDEIFKNEETSNNKPGIKVKFRSS